MRTLISAVALSAALLLSPIVGAQTPTPSLQVDLTCTAPTQNTDGSPLTDLSGYMLRWGTAAGAYTSSAMFPPNACAFQLTDADGLQFSTNYYFVVSAVNSSGVESTYSNVAQAAIPAAPTVPNAPSGLTVTVNVSVQIN